MEANEIEILRLAEQIKATAEKPRTVERNQMLQALAGSLAQAVAV